ncbi:OLC1v1023812C1 [Oldenlandia corymbosa var. corymbosa]|uniref:OLC1v1023812C1 n=1 Tax=Oldenlandia corymbosa var. corymbosa TaxID=529605 RepID=A0AAV1C392_OLDCO|nr:OLC1v1023812C1 [Oldenlandia corymbosa var. corymbosa]
MASGTTVGGGSEENEGSKDKQKWGEPAFGAVSGDSSSQNRVFAGNLTGRGGFLSPETKVTISLSKKSKGEARNLKRRLQSELDEIRSLVQKIEGIEGRKTGNAGRYVDNGGKLKRGQSDKDKRMPKANKYYKNADFVLAKDKFPPAESNKKSKPNAGKKGGGNELGHGSGFVKFSSQMLKSCSSVLDRLMKHKHGWVFNKPVDAVALGLHDYFDVIKSPMDLGTVKSRLSKNWYKSPKDFAEDVRLTFHNAMTYNPKGQDVYLMAEELSQIFEDKWAAIETDYMREMLRKDNEAGLPTPKSKKATTKQMPPSDISAIGRSESTTHLSDSKTKPMSSGHSARVATTKKPKAKDPDKRDMTYDEKQKLSKNLQSLPSEKLENVVQIIRKRNPSLCQNDDEIEVDIDSVDTETLWELDRFVTNYKKSVSKNKRKADLANQSKQESVQNVQEKALSPVALESQKASQIGEDISSSYAEVKHRAGHGSGSSKSSGSNANSGSFSGSVVLFTFF